MEKVHKDLWLLEEELEHPLLEKNGIVKDQAIDRQRTSLYLALSKKKETIFVVESNNLFETYLVFGNISWMDRP